jgi:Mn2+/Fe2+ NRAMP family transporter
MQKSSAILGAVFLMATSAIGPGFLTQTAVFTAELKVHFGFAILISILLDMGVQLNVWRILAVTEMRAQDLANQVFQGAGYFLSSLIVLGGVAFNIGNLAGCGLGLQALFGIPIAAGVLVSVLIAFIVFGFREAGVAMDLFAKVLGILLIGLTLFVAWAADPPLAKAAYHTFLPYQIDTIAILTLVGGTVGGYITFAGAHRLLDANIKGMSALPEVSSGALQAILLASLMRILLFLAALGVVMQGNTLAKENPAASVFQWALGVWGYRFFGLVLWSAAITSVLGSAYTSVSFLRGIHPSIDRNERYWIIGFISFSACIFLCVRMPVQLLLWAGMVNGLILPFALGLMLIAVQRFHPENYRHPILLSAIGWIVVLVMLVFGVMKFAL